MNYQILSPSLEGLLSHESIMYAGIKRPAEVLRAMDGPSTKSGPKPCKASDHKVLELYFNDLQAVFMKKFSSFVSNSEIASQDSLQMQAMLQEMIKVKRLLTNRV